MANRASKSGINADMQKKVRYIIISYEHNRRGAILASYTGLPMFYTVVKEKL